MILRIEEIKKVCSKVLWAVDSGDMSEYCGLVRLHTEGSNLYFTVASNEYSMVAKIPSDDNEPFEAVVDANVFLKLISQVTTDTIELVTDNRVLNIKANGNYKLPMIFEGDALIKYKPIELNNVTNEFVVSNDILKKILIYNTKQLSLSTGGKEVFNYYYFDNHGCITANLGACVTDFELDTQVKLLFNQRLVRLFKLFDDSDAKLTIAKDELSGDIIQTKVKFVSNDIEIKSIISCEDSFTNSYPVVAVRSTANADYDYLSVFKRGSLVETLNRLNLFVSVNKSINQVVKLVFNPKGVTISDYDGNNSEIVYYQNDLDNIDTYTAYVDLKMFKSVLDTINSQYISMRFGNGRAFVLDYDDIKSVIPESKH